MTTKKALENVKRVFKGFEDFYKEGIERMSKPLDIEGISVHAKKGKLDIRIDDWADYTEIETIKLIKWIQQACSEMDLQTKTAEEILNEYNKD